MVCMSRECECMFFFSVHRIQFALQFRERLELQVRGVIRIRDVDLFHGSLVHVTITGIVIILVFWTHGVCVSVWAR
jgi:hypothetical protein